MKQRLSKVIFIITLAISVFLFPCNKASADDYFPQISVIDNTGSYTVNFVTDLSNSSEAKSYTGTYDAHMTFTVTVPAGYVYNGTIQRVWDIPYRTGTMNETIYRMMYLTDYTVTNLADGVTSNVIVVNTGTSLRVTLSLVFTDYFNSIGNTLGGTLVISATQVAINSSGSVDDVRYAAVPVAATDTSGYLDKSLPSEINLGGVISDSSQQQMQQQQQIADQQAQQSAQQHEDLKNGFHDDTYNSNVSNAGSSIDNYVNLESDLMNDKNQQVVNYADQAFKLDSVQPYANAILACSTFYTAIWNSFGEFNIVFVVILALGVAGLVLGLTRRK